MEVRATQLVHLQRLAQELIESGLSAELISKGSTLYLDVANADTPAINERVLCESKEDSWSFWWSWRQPIGSVDELATVVSKIMTVLRPVGGDS